MLQKHYEMLCKCHKCAMIKKGKVKHFLAMFLLHHIQSTLTNLCKGYSNNKMTGINDDTNIVIC